LHIINYKHIFRNYISSVYYVSLNIPPMHGYTTITYQFQTSQHDVKWQFRYGHWKLRVFKVTSYFPLKNSTWEEKTKVILLLLLQFCTLQATKLPIDVFQITGLLMANYTNSFLLTCSWYFDFHYLMYIDSNVIYVFCTRNVLHNFV
jgi:hypothetical protein